MDQHDGLLYLKLRDNNVSHYSARISQFGSCQIHPKQNRPAVAAPKVSQRLSYRGPGLRVSKDPTEWLDHSKAGQDLKLEAFDITGLKALGRQHHQKPFSQMEMTSKNSGNTWNARFCLLREHGAALRITIGYHISFELRMVMKWIHDWHLSCRIPWQEVGCSETFSCNRK